MRVIPVAPPPVTDCEALVSDSELILYVVTLRAKSSRLPVTLDYRDDIMVAPMATVE